MFNLKVFLATAVPTFLVTLPIVMGLVRYWGRLGATGKKQLVASLLTGLVVGGLIYYFQTPPTSAAEWFAIVLFGLLCGLAASGCYEVLKESNEKALNKAIKKGRDIPF